MIPPSIYGKPTSEIYRRIQFLALAVGWWENLIEAKLGGPGNIAEGDGMFVIGKRKCSVVRFHSKEHVLHIMYTVTVRESNQFAILFSLISLPVYSVFLMSIY